MEEAYIYDVSSNDGFSNLCYLNGCLGNFFVGEIKIAYKRPYICDNHQNRLFTIHDHLPILLAIL
jgi:hypothetical protein